MGDDGQLRLCLVWNDESVLKKTGLSDIQVAVDNDKIIIHSSVVCHVTLQECGHLA